MNNKAILILGDVLAIAILTVIGFATHGETDLSYLPRMAASFLPVMFAWFILAPWFGLFDQTIIANPRNLWRIALAMLFAAPLATTLRAVWLGSAALPLFTFVLGSTSAAGMILWRWVYILIAKRTAK
ncbi:MAG TPA: DUF3054 domain-containing protein [Anaerolineales bacterium]|nr:DUF3054 domain-containing protein [Anaerolineales bacterium]